MSSYKIFITHQFKFTEALNITVELKHHIFIIKITTDIAYIVEIVDHTVYTMQSH